VVLLEALGILAELDATRGKSRGALRTHWMIEAIKLAFSDRNRYVGDPRFVRNPLDRLLSEDHFRERAARILDGRAREAQGQEYATMGEGDTTCLASADSSGNVVAYITSLSTPFGCAEVVPETGVLMNNRAGRGFTLDPAAPNSLEPGKRTVSTLHCYIVCDENDRILAGGTSGGDGQPQWNLQILDAVLDGGDDIGAAIDMPRWEITPGSDPAHLGQSYELRLDGRYRRSEVDALSQLGHTISDTPLGMLGAAQAIAVDEQGRMIAAADARADGCALVLE
jgi:gamma-glutamyltranspeptidase/glutathione hydrolase